LNIKEKFVFQNNRVLIFLPCALFLSACATSHHSTRSDSRDTTAGQPQVQTSGQAGSFPAAISMPAAPYPPGLRSKCVGGKVEFKASVSVDGRIADVLILKSPNDDLSRAVIDTVKSKWQFKPYPASPDGELAAFTSYMVFDPECN
jgi:outer membrane biosynthesis protein TonB